MIDPELTFFLLLAMITAIGFLDKRVMMLTGVMWICGALFIWYDLYNFMFYIGIGTGLYFILNGAMEWMN